MKNQKNKIIKAYKIIKKRLPKSYAIQEPRIYSRVYNMLRATANEDKCTYRELCGRYTDYFKKQKKNKTNYIDSKYYKPKSIHHKFQYLTISALGNIPPMLNLENTRNHTLKNYIYLLLHEYGHVFMDKKGIPLNEHKTDLFAIRWIKKINRS